MKTITIRELHHRTGELVREAAQHGEILVTNKGRVVARILPQNESPEVPYFSQRKPSSGFKKLDASQKTARGTDSTKSISQEREDRA